MIGKGKLKNDTVDTLSLAREKFPGSSISLDALCKKYRIDNSKRKQHTALIDCDLLIKVYINLLDQKEPTLDFKKIEEKEEPQNSSVNSYYKKIIVPTAEEIENHKNFLKNSLKKNFFN